MHDNEIENVDVSTSEDGSVDENTGTTCSNQQSSRAFDCQPDSGSLVTFRFLADSGDVSPVRGSPSTSSSTSLTGTTDEVNNVVVANCADASGFGAGGGEDSGATPEGGVDRGAGGTANPSDPASAALIPALAALLALIGGSVALALRKARAAR